jgi:hypothetical protein
VRCDCHASPRAQQNLFRVHQPGLSMLNLLAKLPLCTEAGHESLSDFFSVLLLASFCALSLQ